MIWMDWYVKRPIKVFSSLGCFHGSKRNGIRYILTHLKGDLLLANRLSEENIESCSQIQS